MKVVRKGGASFSPVTVEITFESQSELDALATVANVSHVNDAVRHIFGFSLWMNVGEPLENIGADATRQQNALAEAIVKR